jgi:hypothetical protein
MRFDVSLAVAAPVAGPTVISLLGYDLPILSAVFAVLGVVLSLALAPPPARRLSRVQKWALRIVLVLITLALVIYDQKSPLISLGWAIGLGFSGYTVIELLGAMIPEKLRSVFGASIPDEPSSHDSLEEPK